MKKLGVFCFVLFFMLLLGACQEPSSSPAPSNEGQNENQNQEETDEAAYAQGITDDEILIGLTGPQTGPVAEYDKIRQGLQAYFNYINDNGGVNGRTFKLIAYDDQYQPAKTVQATQRLVEQDKVFAVSLPLGTANVGAVQELLVSTGIPVTGIQTGADKFVNPPIKNFFGDTFNYVIEAKILLDYAVNELGAKKIAIAYQNDDFGLQGTGTIREEIENYDAEIVREVTFLASDNDFSSQAQHLANSDADVIFMVSTPMPAASLRIEMNKIGASDIPYIVTNTGGGDENQFNIAGKDIWEGTISTSKYASLEGLPEIEEYYEYITKDFGEAAIGALTQQSWAHGQVLVETFRRAGDNLTWENFIAQMESFDKWDGSLNAEVTYTPEHRYGITTLYIIQAQDGELVPVTGAIYYDPETKEINY
ncbi:ABC transporter substrate-binding protein [Alkalihalobacterium alkalinitrilicum]|uniref:ABC transporter substrate-binding protein n=1 Tax=Alkalihalobacterium alkalinitrilicum TaxID=427920 RepID=UPI000994ABE5|nr:ABC transporter substrate-binding protein [Alkalihalobacterium alkalinitrilicum]